MFASLLSVLTLAVASTSALKHGSSHANIARMVKEKVDLVARADPPAPGTVIHSCTVPNTVALTFDDGPYIYVNDVVDTLNAANAKGTFFINGNNMGGCVYNQDQVDRLRYIDLHGHQLASHTWAHQDLATLTWDQVHHQMWLTEEALMRIVGKYPAFVRPPFGSYNGMVIEAARVRGQAIAIWDFDSEDWKLSAPEVLANYTTHIAKHPSNILTLNHDIHEATALTILPEVIEMLQTAGYQLVTLAECLGKAPYQWETTPFTRDEHWTCDK